MDHLAKKDLAAHIKNALQVSDALGLTKVGIALNAALVELDGIGTPPADGSRTDVAPSTSLPQAELSQFGK
ncbi:hypothetical protein CA236_18280 [Sphingomonas sp. ABOLG]|uniref:hypothetical protein n=1 Tax=Sphingomonas sp. ABOLG TaxID=1985880 RepID=UPI000F7D7ABE|nr:hypothetical protein [Sphingomonas sp. ABOLG]RSV12374.1 hypothetical protein CA236_18280 [Sphingomonas sp. ABOLG]